MFYKEKDYKMAKEIFIKLEFIYPNYRKTKIYLNRIEQNVVKQGTSNSRQKVITNLLDQFETIQ